MGARFSLADIAAKANASSAASAQASANASAAAAAAAAARATEVFAAGSRKGVAGGPGGKAAKLWSKLLSLTRVVDKVFYGVVNEGIGAGCRCCCCFLE